MQDEKTDIWDFFHRYAASLADTSAAAYRKAIRSAHTFLTDIASPSVADIADWLVALARSGNTLKTASYYLDNIASLHSAAVREDLLSPSDAFKTVKARLRALPPAADKAAAGFEDAGTALARLRSLIRHAPLQTGETAIFTDLFILALLDPSRGLLKTASLVKDDIPALPEEAREVARRHLSSRRKYVFPLAQSEMTPRQLLALVGENIVSILRQRGVPVYGGAAPSIDTLWALAALQCGFKASEVVAALGHAPAALPWLSLAEPSTVPAFKRQAIIESTAISLIDDPLQWHVMHLRQGVRMDAVTRRLELFNDKAPAPDIYYPCEEIARRIGKKLVYKEKPLIADIAFFRCRESAVFPLFQHIGDLAWCYREEHLEGRPYSVVPDASMMTFMQTVGILMPGIDVYPIGEIPLSENDVVCILGGPFIGRQATVESLLPPPKTNPHPQPSVQWESSLSSPHPSAQRASSLSSPHPTVVRLRITADNGIEWRVSLPPQLLRPLPPVKP